MEKDTSEKWKIDQKEKRYFLPKQKIRDEKKGQCVFFFIFF